MKTFGTVFTVAVALVIALSSALADIEEPWWQEAEGLDQAALTKILGSSPAAWSFKDWRGNAMQPSLGERDGRPVLLGQSRGFVLQGLTSYEPGTEVAVVLRFTPLGRSVHIATGLRDLTKKDEGLVFTLSRRSGDTIVTCIVRSAGKGNRDHLARHAYELKWLSKRSLGWPEPLRRLIEHDLASLPSVFEKWIAVRWLILDGGGRLYVDDRLLWDGTGEGKDLSGKIRITLPAGVELASVRTRRVEHLDSQYEPIPLEGYLNASAIRGSKVRREALPKPDTVAKVQGIPFSFPVPDQEGRDHIDIGKSWVKFAYLSERESPRRGKLGGRWKGAFSVDPSRIQLTVPTGRYRAIHLIAATDGEKNSVPIITAQFYRPSGGRPVSFVGRVPLFVATSTNAVSLPVELENGRKGNLYLVTIPIDPGALAGFDDLKVLEVELTKEVKLYRAYPDPMYYSTHQAGLPSGVHVYAVTLERPVVHLELSPDNYADVWTAPEKPGYAVTLKHSLPKTQRVGLEWTTASYDGEERTSGKKRVNVPKGTNGVRVAIGLSLKRYGYHTITMRMTHGEQIWTENRTLTLLHEDTRERGNWERGRGPIFGFWNWRGNHNTPPGDRQTYIMGLAGAGSTSGSFGDKRVKEEEKVVARKFKMVTFKAFSAGDHYITGQFAGNLKKLGLAEAKKIFLERLRKAETKPSDITRAEFISFYPEPNIGHHTSGTLPSYYGEPESSDLNFSDSEEERFQLWLNGFIEGAKIVKENWPGVKCMLPHGDPTFATPFLRRSKEARALIDGVTVDIPCFERLPEQQLHQVSLHRMYINRQEFKKAGIENPWLPMYEGPSLPTRPGSLNGREHADLTVRNSLILLAYGVDMQLGGLCPFDAGSYWGEQHYGGGMFNAMPLITARPTYAAFASMTRHLNGCNFDRWLPTGSLSVYALQFKHHKTGEPVLVLWTLRGKRPVTMASKSGRKIEVFDQMDNVTSHDGNDKGVTIVIDQSPRYVHGLAVDAALSLGAPDHSDAAPSDGSLKIASLGDGSWKLSDERDEDYEKSFETFIRRFPGKMSASVVPAPEDKGKAALSVQLGKQDRERKTMPFYTTLVPGKAVKIPGKASHIGLWVKGASDWGRVIYFMRDAKGEKWISIGTAGAWNCDDLHSWSYFCFDGWRYLRFEMPSFSPYDTFREKGTTWWGPYGRGDDVLDLPLKLEKIVVERRTHAMYVNDPQPTRPDDVLLADLYAEYESDKDKGKDVIRLSRLRMPVPKGMPELDNPIETMIAEGTGQPTAITRITLPEQHADGTRCYVHFEPVDGASHYDVWVGPYANGSGALQLGKKWKESGGLIRGLRPDTDFYVFLVYADKEGKQSKPSAGYKIRLKDLFGMK